MAVLHELLAVEAGLAETATRISKEVTKVLDSKSSLFTGMHKAHSLFNEADQHMVQAAEVKEVESTVADQLNYLGTELARYWDVTYLKEEANQRAKADIIVDNKVIASNVPAIVLLSMEKKLTALLATYNAIPTLDAAKAWEIDPTYARPFVYRTKYVTERHQTQTKKKWQEISPATVQHKAQVAEVDETTVIGKYTITEFSGATTSLDKAEKLQRLTALIRAVKSARQRANSTEVSASLFGSFGLSLIDYINNGI